MKCALEIPSGLIVVAVCTDYFPEAARIEVVPGTYRARVAYGGLDTLSEDGLDGNHPACFAIAAAVLYDAVPALSRATG